MSKVRVIAHINPLLLEPLDKYAASHGLSRDFILAVAIDQFLSDPDNGFIQEAATKAVTP